MTSSLAHHHHALHLAPTGRRSPPPPGSPAPTQRPPRPRSPRPVACPPRQKCLCPRLRPPHRHVRLPDSACGCPPTGSVAPCVPPLHVPAVLSCHRPRGRGSGHRGCAQLPSVLRWGVPHASNAAAAVCSCHSHQPALVGISHVQPSADRQEQTVNLIDPGAQK